MTKKKNVLNQKLSRFDRLRQDFRLASTPGQHTHLYTIWRFSNETLSVIAQEKRLFCLNAHFT